MPQYGTARKRERERRKKNKKPAAGVEFHHANWLAVISRRGFIYSSEPVTYEETREKPGMKDRPRASRETEKRKREEPGFVLVSCTQLD